MHRVAFESANLLKALLVMVATMLAICLLALVETKNTAKAEGPRQYNGKIAFTHTVPYRIGDYSDFYTVNPDGTGLTNLTFTSETNTRVSERSAAFSPDGTKLAASIETHPKSEPLGTSDIYVGAIAGSKASRLTSSDDYRFQVVQVVDIGSWSPDGTKIAYTCKWTGWEGYEICTVDADGSNFLRLTTSENSEDPAWSPDGSTIAFTASGGIHTINPDGSNRTLAIAGGDQPDWSPDGTRMAYRRYPPGQGYSDIFVANADGSNPVDLTAKIGGRSADGTKPDEAVPAWSPDGTKIAFSSNRDEKIETDYEIYVIDANGRNLERLTHVSGVDWGPDWQPLTKPMEAISGNQQEEHERNQQPPPQQSQQDSNSRSVTVHPPNTGGPSLLLVASALLFSGGVMFYAVLKRRM